MDQLNALKQVIQAEPGWYVVIMTDANPKAPGIGRLEIAAWGLVVEPDDKGEPVNRLIPIITNDFAMINGMTHPNYLGIASPRSANGRFVEVAKLLIQQRKEEAEKRAQAAQTPETPARQPST